MKSKKFTYLLILGVALVWGIIFYRIFAAMNEEEPMQNLTVATKTEYFKLIDHSQDSVQLTFNYGNPFKENHVEAPIVEAKMANQDKSPVVQPYKPVVNWTGISFTGYVINPTTKRKIVILQVNGKEVLLTEGQTSNGVKLLKNAGDSVQVQYQNSSKYIRIK
jgi:hypothetical protein